MSEHNPGRDTQPHAPGVPDTSTVGWGTVVWGAVIVALAALLLVADAGWLVVDPRTAAITFLVVLGVGLMVGGGLASLRRRGPRQS
ncbi:hypothetical protein [Sinomonas halotolerans]|uniref:DUF2530 domain-containing protein n=1 Tax=Sinomonas halotolerans TaxID=1644133 RepID=A0ABU9WY94_9MICC